MMNKNDGINHNITKIVWPFSGCATLLQKDAQSNGETEKWRSRGRTARQVMEMPGNNENKYCVLRPA